MPGWRIPILRLTIAVAIPALLLAGFEALLRGLGAGSSPAFLIPQHFAARAVWTDNPHYTRRFFGPGLERSPWPFVLDRQKEDRAVRIVVLGESAAMGDPKPEFGFARILEVLLQDAYPGLRFDVLNAAVTAINSHVVRDIARDTARAQPDVVVVYMGNNEVIGPYGPGTVHQAFSGSLPYIRLSLAVRATRISQLAQAMIHRGSGRAREWLGMEMFLDKRIARDDPRMAAVYGHFERNLRDILAGARGAGALPILSTVAVNVRDCAPFASLHGRQTAAASNAWEAAWTRGLDAERQHQWTPALAAYEEAAALDPSFAESHFRAARMLDLLERREEARVPYEAAKEADALRFRADSRLNGIVRDAAVSEPGVSFVDFERIARDASPHGLAGASLFVDHVHLNFAGNYLLARSVFDAMRDRLGPPMAGIPDESACRARLAFTPWDEHKLAEHMYRRFLQPPFTHQVYHAERMEAAGRELRARRLALDSATRDASAAAYRAALRSRPDDWVLKRQFGALLIEQGDITNAVQELRDAARMIPQHAPARYSLARALAEDGRLDDAWALLKSLRLPAREKADAFNQIGLDLAEAGRWSIAARLFDEALRLDPRRSEAHSNLGIVLLRMGDSDRGLDQLRRALELKPDNVKARTNLGTALARRGEREQAARELQRAVELQPNDSDAQFNWGVFLLEDQKWDEARHAFEAAIAADPESADAHANLGLILSRESALAPAREQFELALRLDPHLRMPHRQLASLDVIAGDGAAAVGHFEASMGAPDDAAQRAWFARRLIEAGFIREARGQLEASLMITNDTADVANDLAWLLATSEPGDLRDAAAAVRWATHASTLMKDEGAGALDTLAAAYAEAGRFPDAVAAARRGLALAETNNLVHLARQIRTRLALYEKGQPFRDPLFANRPP